MQQYVRPQTLHRARLGLCSCGGVLRAWKLARSLHFDHQVRCKVHGRGVAYSLVKALLSRECHAKSAPTDDITRHTGAARSTRLRMRPMSLFETGHATRRELPSSREELEEGVGDIQWGSPSPEAVAEHAGGLQHVDRVPCGRRRHAEESCGARGGDKRIPQQLFEQARTVRVSRHGLSGALVGVQDLSRPRGGVPRRLQHATEKVPQPRLPVTIRAHALQEATVLGFVLFEVSG